MRINHFALAAAGTLSLVAGVASAQLSATEFETTPTFVETFAGGSTVGQWQLDPGLAAAAITGAPATYVTSTPPGVNAAVVTLNPVGASSDGGVMMQGNASSTAGADFGLNYMQVINSAAAGTGTDFTTLTKYRVVASVYLYSPTEIATRWQVGPYALNGDLFRAAAFYNSDAAGTGGGPGFGTRAASTASTTTTPGTAALASARYTLMSVMVDASDADSANWRVATCVDANGDLTLDEADPLEYQAFLLNPARGLPGAPGMFTVGGVANDTFPLFVDTFSLYLPVPPTAAETWPLY